MNVLKEKVKKAKKAIKKVLNKAAAVPTEHKAIIDGKETAPIIAFKGFDSNFKCREKQYAENSEYSHSGEVSACRSGIHACPNPMDVLGYYPIVDGSGKFNRFAKVECSGQIQYHNGKEKLACGHIKIMAELKFSDFVGAMVSAVADICKTAFDIKSRAAGATAENDNGRDDARIGSSGIDARIGSSGIDAQIGSSGIGAQIGSSGIGARIGSSGNDARITAEGDRSVIAAIGIESKIKAKKGCWITLAEYTYNNKESRYEIKEVKSAMIDGAKLKEDIFYCLKNGEFTEVR